MGSHPLREDGPVERDVCFSQIDDRCVARLRILVRRCYGHYVYKFHKTKFPFNARYCQEPDTTGTNHGSQRDIAVTAAAAAAAVAVAV